MVIFLAACDDNCIDVDKIDRTKPCTGGYNPVCGCDEFQYDNACDADRNGVIFYIQGPCP